MEVLKFGEGRERQGYWPGEVVVVQPKVGEFGRLPISDGIIPERLLSLRSRESEVTPCQEVTGSSVLQLVLLVQLGAVGGVVEIG